MATADTHFIFWYLFDIPTNKITNKYKNYLQKQYIYKAKKLWIFLNKRLYQFHHRNQVNIFLALSGIPIICYFKALQAYLRQQKTTTWWNWINKMIHHRTTTLHVIPHYKPSQFTETPTKQWLLLKRLFWPKAWHYCQLF